MYAWVSDTDVHPNRISVCTVQVTQKCNKTDIMKMGTSADRWVIRRVSNACMSAQMELFDVKQAEKPKTQNATKKQRHIYLKLSDID